eukprot:gene4094-2941_t
MGIIRYLAGLAEIPKEYGAVTAMDGRDNDLVVGTDQGFLMHLRVECDPDGHPDAHCKVESEAVQVFTAVVGVAQVSEEHEPITHLQCSQRHPVVFALCDGRLGMYHVGSWRQSRIIGHAVQRFSVTDGVLPQRWTWLCGLPDSDVDSASPKDISTVAFCTSDTSEIHLMHVDVVASHRRPWPESVALPMPLEALAAAGNHSLGFVLYFKRGLQLLLLDTPEARIVPLSLPMPIRQPRHAPLLAVSLDMELAVCLEGLIFTCSLGDALARPAGDAVDYGAACSSNTGLLDRRDRDSEVALAWHRTRRAQQDLTCIAMRYPHLLQFSSESCTIGSVPRPGETGDGDGALAQPQPGDQGHNETETVQLPGVRVVVRPWSGQDKIFAASRTTVWMIVLEPLQAQWEALVEQDRMTTALRWCYREWTRQLLPVDKLRAMEEDVRRRSSFQLLRQGRIAEAMYFLRRSSLDVRELLLLVPECLPAGSGCAEEAANAPGDSYWAQWAGACAYNTHTGRIAAPWREAHRRLERKSGALRTDNDAAVEAFVEQCWRNLKNELSRWMEDRLAQLPPPQQRAAAYAFLVLTLERRDYRSAHDWCNSPHLHCCDAEPLLHALREHRLLALAHWTHGERERAAARLRSRLTLSALPSAGMAMQETWTHRVWAGERLVGEIGAGWLALPQALRERTAVVLLGLDPSAAHLGASAETWWVQEVATLCGKRRAAAVEAAQRRIEGLQTQADSAEGDKSALLKAVLPGLEVEFVLLEHMDLHTLGILLSAEPWRATSVDIEGSSLLHLALSLLGSASRADRQGVANSGMVLRDATMAAMSLLIDAGCPTDAINAKGLSCVDVVSLYDPAHTDELVAAMMSCRANKDDDEHSSSLEFVVLAFSDALSVSARGENNKNDCQEPTRFISSSLPSSFYFFACISIINMDVFTDKDYSKKFIGNLPEKIQQRLALLLHYHEEFQKIEEEFEDKEMEVRQKYNASFAPLYARRKEIVTGEAGPTDEEVEAGFDSEEHDRKLLTEGEESDEKGIKDFWLKVLEGHIVIQDLIKPEDVPVLSKLVDISSKVIPGKMESFEVTFTFAPNNCFEETQLTLSVVSDKTKTTIKKSPMTLKDQKFLYLERKTKGKGGKAGKTETVPRESFFWIFKETESDPNVSSEALEDVALEEEQLLNLLHTMHHKVIPGAINFYTGEMDGASDVDDDEEYEEDEEDSDEDN